MPPILAQNDFRRLAGFDPGFNLLGGVVTAILSLEPGLALRKDATPAALSPPVGFFPALRCQAAVLATVFWTFHQLAVRHAMKSFRHFFRSLFLFCVCHYKTLLKPGLCLPQSLTLRASRLTATGETGFFVSPPIVPPKRYM
jgi:hypothetical protein